MKNRPLVFAIDRTVLYKNHAGDFHRGEMSAFVLYVPQRYLEVGKDATKIYVTKLREYN